MASTRRLKHHARFHAAVLRYLFPLSPHSSNSNTHQEAVGQNHDEDYFQARSPESVELVAEEKHSDHEGVEVGKASLSRAQRKRLKLKKVKETEPDAVPAKKKDDTAEKCHTPTNTGDGQDVHDAGQHESLSIGTEDEKRIFNGGDLESLCTDTGEGKDVHDGVVGTEDEKHMHNAGELESLCTNTGEGKDVHEGAECEFLSRAKRRRLAKKKFQNFPRRPVAGSSFTAEIRGEDIIIKQIL